MSEVGSPRRRVWRGKGARLDRALKVIIRTGLGDHGTV